MGFEQIILIGVALSMDAVAVTMTNGMVYRNVSRTKTISMPILFGVFQGLMPLLGYFIGGIFADVLSRYAGILVCIILGTIGLKMIKDGLSHEEDQDQETLSKTLSYKVLVMQAIATSIDAFAVGVGFSAMQIAILPAVSTIAIITIICCIGAIFIGRKFGNWLGDKSELLGGVILVFLAIQSLL